MGAVWKFIANTDSRNRVTLKVEGGIELATHYEAEVFESGRIVLHPRVLAAPEEVIGQRTVTAIGNAVANAKQGKTGETFDPVEFEDLLEEENPSR